MDRPQELDSSTTLALQDLLSQLQSGENVETIKKQLVARAYSRLRILAHKMLNSYNRHAIDEETEGLVAEAYLRLDRSLDDLQPETVRQFFGLAALQMRRHLLDKLRSIHGRGQVKRPKVSSLNSNEASSPGLEIAMETPLTPWSAIDILEALDELDERERDCLTMQHWYGFTHQEIANLLQLSTKTVQRSCNMAIIKLNDRLRSYRSDDADTSAS
ncbi:MAG: sigma-70 family RNA polymerase sigma factor [Pirellulales bacterium]